MPNNNARGENMAEITITLPEGDEARIIHALCAQTGQEETVENAKQALLNHITMTVQSVERSERIAAVLSEEQETAPLGLS